MQLVSLRVLKPQDVLSIFYLVVTLPLCYIAASAGKPGPMWTRAILLPIFCLLRPLAMQWRASAGDRDRDRNSNNGSWLSSLLSSGCASSKRAATFAQNAMLVAAAILPGLIYPIGYGEMGTFIHVIHTEQECHNDKDVQVHNLEIFKRDSTCARSGWRSSGSMGSRQSSGAASPTAGRT